VRGPAVPGAAPDAVAVAARTAPVGGPADAAAGPRAGAAPQAPSARELTTGSPQRPKGHKEDKNQRAEEGVAVPILPSGFLCGEPSYAFGGAVCLACRRRASCDFLRAARLGWMTRLAAALSSFLAARLYSLRNSSTGPSAAARTRLICDLIV